MAETLIGDIIHDIDSENRDLSDIRDRLVKLGFETTIDGPFAFYSKSGEYFHKELFVWGILDECPITVHIVCVFFTLIVCRKYSSTNLYAEKFEQSAIKREKSS
jgi:hypothetical protein